MKQNKQTIPLILFIGLIIRLIFSLIIHPVQNYVFSDMQSYLDIATRIVKGVPRLDNIFYPPGYSLFLSLFSQTSNQHFYIFIAVCQSLIGVLSIWLFYQISTQVLKPKLSKIFLLILVFYYPFIDATGYLLSENLAIFFLALVVWFSIKFKQTKSNLWLFYAGLSLGFGSLVRANLLIIGLAILVWLIASSKQKLKPIAVFIIATLASLIFISGVYFKLGGQYRITPLNGGLNFFQGQCLVGHTTDVNGAAFGPPVYMQRDIHKTAFLDQPFTNSHYFYQQGWQCLKQRPVRMLEKISENYYVFFGNVSWPTSNQPFFGLPMKISHILFNLLVFPGILLAIVHRPRQPFTNFLWLILFTVFLTATVYYADIRYRLPYDAIFIIIALSGYQSLMKPKNYTHPGIKR
ncbi:glycosyltransferase family 39 protein [Patescibacteria group bacterium]|nr:glycosyltransferase family 39 protein [Patescibacteria group bacterium]